MEEEKGEKGEDMWRWGLISTQNGNSSGEMLNKETEPSLQTHSRIQPF